MISDAFQSCYGVEPTLAVRAPGRVDLMGSHTDYNNGKVLTLTLDRGITMLARPRKDGQVRLHSLDLAPDAVFDATEPSRAGVTGWGRYVQGVAVELVQARRSLVGADILVYGDLPRASGLSSSAALEAAAITVFEGLGGFRLDRLEKARLAQRAENEWVGVPCGILDQYSTILGEQGSALLLDCRSLSHRRVALPPTLGIVLANTREPRELKTSEYGTRRRECEAAVTHMASIDPSIAHLRDVTAEALEAQADRLDPTVYRRARFIVHENARVDALAVAMEASDMAKIGQLMNDSFADARDDFELCTEPMRRMQAAIERAPGVIGSRQAGGGFGGCLVALVERDATAAFCTAVAEAYRLGSGLHPDVFPVSSAHPAGNIPLAALSSDHPMPQA